MLWWFFPNLVTEEFLKHALKLNFFMVMSAWQNVIDQPQSGYWFWEKGCLVVAKQPTQSWVQAKGLCSVQDGSPDRLFSVLCLRQLVRLLSVFRCALDSFLWLFQKTLWIAHFLQSKVRFFLLTYQFTHYSSFLLFIPWIQIPWPPPLDS